MSTLTIKSTVSREVEKKITLPAFWKKENGKYLAAIDEKTCIKFFASEDGEYISVSHSTCQFSLDDIAEAEAKWDPTTEQEFLSAYDDAHESIRMKPMLIDTGRDEAHRDLAITQNF